MFTLIIAYELIVLQLLFIPVEVELISFLFNYLRL